VPPRRRLAILAVTGVVALAVLLLIAAGCDEERAPTAGLELTPVNAGGPVGLAHLEAADGRARGWLAVWGLGPGSGHRAELRGPEARCPRAEGDTLAALPDLTADENGVAFARLDLPLGGDALATGNQLMVYANPRRSRGNARVACGQIGGGRRVSTAELTALGPGSAARADVSAIVQLRGGRSVGPAQRIEARVGDRVALALRADLADELEIVGLGLTQQVGPGTIARFSFRAPRAGSFPIAGTTTGGRAVARLVIRRH
jgi:hypothetical protein